MPDIIQRYGWNWDAATPDLEIELQAIRWGGEWRVKGGQWCGKGLFYHYRRAFELLWPEDDNHRWSDLVLKTILWETITVICGGKDSSKTRSAGKYALVDYWAFPEETLILMTSTDLRGADYRVWGDVKSLFIRAKDRYDWLPGKALEAKHSICTDDLEETDVRDPRKGLTFLPMFGSGGQWMGLSKAAGIKQKRRRLLGDECFPAGTLVNTAHGPKPIESISPGELVWSAIGLAPVVSTGSRIAEQLVRVRMQGGREIVCTPNHPFLTQKGWIKACELGVEHYMLAFNETMSILSAFIQGKAEFPNFLQSVLLSEVDARIPGSPGQNVNLQKRMVEIARRSEGQNGRTNESQKSNAQRSKLRQGSGLESSLGAAPCNSWRQRNRTNAGGSCIDKDGSELCMEFSDSHRHEGGQRIPNMLQSGYSGSFAQVSNRSRRENPRQPKTPCLRSEKGRVPSGAWVDGVEILKQDDPRIAGTGASGYRVYNLQVAGHPSYSVQGLIVHNCQFNKSDYIDTLSNLNSGDFKGIFLGNPIGENDPLDRLAEPVGGWGTEGAVTKTTSWRNKFGGVTITLYGPDSPNFDFPQANGYKKYSYLIGQRDIDWIANTYGKDSSKYWMQAVGVRRAGIDAKRVITLQFCEQHGAMEPAIWSGGATTWVAALDAAYGGIGGDRCILQFVEFGPTLMVGNQPKPPVFVFDWGEPTTKTILKCYPPILVPVSVSNSSDPEEQIAVFCKNQCETRGVPPSHFFFDGRGTLAIQLARIWSPDCNAVEFGGPATKRPVSQDHWVYDTETHSRRLKRCEEEYSKFVTELWFSWKYTILSGQLRELPRETMLEGCRREWRPVSRDRDELETKAEMKERTNQSPDLADALCFPENTLILTPSGEVPIQSLSVGDRVITPLGITEVAIRRKRQARDFVSIALSNGRQLIGTKDHKIFTWNKRWVRLDAFSVAHECESAYNLPIWNILNLLFTRAGSTGFKAMADTIKTGATLRRRDFYTELSGRSTMEIFPSIILSTIKMGIGLIIGSRIWNWSKLRSIAAITCEDARHFLNALLKKLRPSVGFMPQSGIGLRREGLGTYCMQSTAGRTESLLRLNARFVAADSTHTFRKKPNSVQTDAGLSRAIKKPITLSDFVRSAAEALRRISTGRRKLVPLTVTPFSVTETETVYNLTLLEHNAYYANGVLVQNCTAIEGARRLGFQISKMGNTAAAASSNQWIEDLARKTRELHRSKELVPT